MPHTQIALPGTIMNATVKKNYSMLSKHIPYLQMRHRHSFNNLSTAKAMNITHVSPAWCYIVPCKLRRRKFYWNRGTIMTLLSGSPGPSQPLCSDPRPALAINCPPPLGSLHLPLLHCHVAAALPVLICELVTH